MSNTYKTAHQTLHAIYDKHQRKYRGNTSSTQQMCCMWSTKNPPDSLIDTQPICDIEHAFNIRIDENEAIEIYDMVLDEAVKKILKMQSAQFNQEV